MPGGEYLTPDVLRSLWDEVLEAWRAEIAATPGTVEAWLAAKDPAWSVVGRVHLHLAENRRDPERPFAFLATYTTGLAASGKPQHRPLGDAVREASSAADRRRLLALLQPVQRASRAERAREGARRLGPALPAAGLDAATRRTASSARCPRSRRAASWSASPTGGAAAAPRGRA